MFLPIIMLCKYHGLRIRRAHHHLTNHSIFFHFLTSPTTSIYTCRTLSSRTQLRIYDVSYFHWPFSPSISTVHVTVSTHQLPPLLYNDLLPTIVRSKLKNESFYTCHLNHRHHLSVQAVPTAKVQAPARSTTVAGGWEPLRYKTG